MHPCGKSGAKSIHREKRWKFLCIPVLDFLDKLFFDDNGWQVNRNLIIFVVEVVWARCDFALIFGGSCCSCCSCVGTTVHLWTLEAGNLVVSGTCSLLLDVELRAVLGGQNLTNRLGKGAGLWKWRWRE